MQAKRALHFVRSEPPAASNLRILHAGEYLVRAGDRRGSVCVVTSGCLMSFLDDALGREHVTAFHLRGDYVGLDSLYLDTYPRDIIALDTSSIRPIDLDAEPPAVGRDPCLLAIGRELNRSPYFMADTTAEERFAAFFLDLSSRFGRAGFSRTRFRLPMSRTQMGSYLRLTPCTVSSLMTQFRDEGVVAAVGREVELRDLSRLAELSRMYAEDRREITLSA